jgi:hypothetical protein
MPFELRKLRRSGPVASVGPAPSPCKFGPCQRGRYIISIIGRTTAAIDEQTCSRSMTCLNPHLGVGSSNTPSTRWLPTVVCSQTGSLRICRGCIHASSAESAQ